MGKHTDDNDFLGVSKIRTAQPGQKTAVNVKPKSKKLPLVLVVLIDILLVGVGLVVFALFHHVLPRGSDTEEIELPNSAETEVI